MEVKLVDILDEEKGWLEFNEGFGYENSDHGSME